MNPMRSAILLAVLWVSGSLLFAAENTVPKPAAAPAEAVPAAAQEEGSVAKSESSESVDSDTAAKAADEAAAATEPESAAATEADEDPAKGRASAADRDSSPQRFVPSEQVRADFDVSFPIDI